MNSSFNKVWNTLEVSCWIISYICKKKVLRIYLVAIKIIAYFSKTGSMFESEWLGRPLIARAITPTQACLKREGGFLDFATFLQQSIFFSNHDVAAAVVEINLPPHIGPTGANYPQNPHPPIFCCTKRRLISHATLGSFPIYWLAQYITL